MRSIFLLTVLGLSIAGEAAVASERSAAHSGLQFVQKYCLSCHDAANKKGDLDLSRFADEVSLLSSRKTWSNVVAYVRNGEMPPRNKPLRKSFLSNTFRESGALLSRFFPRMANWWAAETIQGRDDQDRTKSGRDRMTNLRHTVAI